MARGLERGEKKKMMQEPDTILIGDKSKFAIESNLTDAYVQKDGYQSAHGFIVIHVGGFQYGIRDTDVNMLGPCVLSFISARINRRGRHHAPFATESDPGKIADAFRDAIYSPDQEMNSFFGIPQPEFSEMFRNIEWSSDLDEAFDDGSYLLHFDIGNRVRLIAFQTSEHSYHHNPSTLRDVWIDVDEYYGVLSDWCLTFKSAWASKPRTSP